MQTKKVSVKVTIAMWSVYECGTSRIEIKKKLQFERFQNLIGAVSDKQKQEPNRTRFGLIFESLFEMK